VTRRIVAIALNTFRENRRDRVLFVLLGFAVLLVVASLLMGQLSPFDQSKILLDLSLTSITLIGTLISIFLGVTLVSREIERRTVFVLIAKPVSRVEFILGKFFGLAATLATATALMSVIVIATLLLRGLSVSTALLQSLFLLYLELLVMTSCALLFSSFSTTILASIYTSGVWIIGHLAGDIRFFGGESDSVFIQKGSGILYRILPNLEALNARSHATYGIPLETGQFLWSSLYGLLYAGAFLGFACVIFEHRDFK
jgi:Cu-processing system permease protein